MSEIQSNAGEAGDNDDFLSGEGEGTFGGFAYAGGEPGVITKATIAGRRPGENVSANEETTYGSGFDGWSYVTDFTLEVTNSDSGHTPGPTLYNDGGRPNSQDPQKAYYCTRMEAHIEESSGGGGGGGGGGGQRMMRMNVTRTWTELPVPTD